MIETSKMQVTAVNILFFFRMATMPNGMIVNAKIILIMTKDFQRLKSIPHVLMAIVKPNPITIVGNTISKIIFKALLFLTLSKASFLFINKRIALKKKKPTKIKAKK